MSNANIPSLRLLMGFEAAARLGSFSRAAEERHLSQSAISHQIQQLEAQIGQPLFSRAGRGVELTVAGEVLLRSVQLSLDTLRSGLGRIASYLDPGLVVLVCPAPLLQGWLQPRLDELRRALPALCPLLSTDESARFVDELDVDINIVARPLQQQGLLEVPFLQDERVVVAAPALAAQLAARPLAEHARHAELICLEESITRDDGAELFRGPLAGFRKGLIYDDARLLLDSARRGTGIASVSRLLADEALARGELVLLPGYPRLPGGHWWLSRVEGETRSPLVRHLFDWLRAEAGSPDRHAPTS
ncbi:LysR family transcriptional regulator [Jeongeupia sp. USM3]|uniref:LysR family transcriptional regulator n=1 Tax=Jeongeupia sp. USM3 TaxID=1906741 RepID=UPI00089DE14D|nr:LysR family transcriptional regulator [Jeongeupia sp. USM3]AOX99013.1 LysR family transcriptional regulator [Jeongeupia sp. USM3]